MALPPTGFQQLSRRSLLKGLGLTPLLLRASPLIGEWKSTLSQASSPPPLSLVDLRYDPSYPARSPLEDVLRRLRPGSDEFVTEGYAHEIGLILDSWTVCLKERDFARLRTSFHDSLEASSFVPTREVALRQEGGIHSFTREFNPALTQPGERLVRELERWLPSDLHIRVAELEITAIDVLPGEPLSVRTNVRYSIVATSPKDEREQRIGLWQMDWSRSSSGTDAESWNLRRWQPTLEKRTVLQGPAFVDITPRSLGNVPSYREQLLRGADEWRTQLDGASGIDVYGNNGVAAGDYDGDGFDDLYICQPAGLPNRLYRNRGDGTFEDVTEKAGVAVLDNTACAIFADFRNIGRQDLLVVCGTGPLLFLNRGDGTFERKHDAFRFSRPPEGTFTHAAVADYDGDGRLDIYFCVYSYYLGLDQYHYPMPYFDARNGPPNFLFHNEGDAAFVDRTEASGLTAENDRYSFACAWGESVKSGSPDLYVVNDFGRNNLYRNQGNGTFKAVSTQAHVQDVGAGMSAAWADINNDGNADLYAANMWSAAGQRVSQQKLFHEKSPEAIRALYRTHARGNALYRNQGDGTFQNVSASADVEVGRWAWCSDFLDFDHDGFQDIYVTNGYITSPVQDGTAATEGKRNVRNQVVKDIDLGSFFWRQVVGKSSDAATPSLAYEHGWNALNELIRTDNSWSGNERNVLLANNRDGTFSEVSGPAGLDFLEDGRSFALADLDHDGRLEIILKNRNAPQIRILRNTLKDIGGSIPFRLRGTTSNRDAIGTAITLTVGDLKQTRYVQAGSGFLAQHSKNLFFGIGHAQTSIDATVHWPSGLVQQFKELPANHQIELTEGKATFTAKPFSSSPAIHESAESAHDSHTSPAEPVHTWLLDPLKAPGFSLPDLAGSMRTLSSTEGKVTLLHFWSIDSPACSDQLVRLQRDQRAMQAAGVELLTVNVDRAESLQKAREYAARQKFNFPVLFATQDIAGIYNIIFRYLYDRRRNLPLPGWFLLDSQGMIVKVYQGTVSVQQVVADARSIPATQQQRFAKALPFPGTLHEAQFVRNDFTYGVAMFQHGYLEQAAASFQQVVAARPNDAEGYYNLGTLSLRRNRFEEAKQYLQKTLSLKPDYPEAWNNLGMLAGQLGQMEEAIQNFRQSLVLRPGYATALVNLGNVYRRNRSFHEAEDYLTQALALQPDDPEINYSVGMLYAQQNQSKIATDYLRKALVLRPDYPEALNNLGVLAVHDKDYAEAERQFQTCVRLVPTFDESYLNLARLYVLEGQRAKAREALQGLLTLKPDNTAAKQGIAVLDAQP
ncbi:FG-GAP-like repeat-containing protein [Terriglobus sp. TAA 43]|uniref:FG-GAP-like repeat-containing protein n=1 Tax=Terriglobus sp. TAA 43 TaxID=278961 RepID=UPI000646FC79|nr:FG-GAP-like repeat-containing protein [Terriglobus sp. TAA 43]